MLKSILRDSKGVSARIGRLLLIVLLMTSSLASYAQQYPTFKVKFINARVEQVFEYMANNTEYQFEYDAAKIAALPKLSIDRTIGMQELIRFCLSNSGLSFIFQNKKVIIKPMSEISAQTQAVVRVSGLIIDRTTNLPIAGATIVGVGTQKGAITNPKGEFSILLPQKDNLSIETSFLGMVPEKTTIIHGGKIAVKDITKIRVELAADQNTIDDIVVTGIVNISKKSFTGSSTTITREELKRVSPTNILSAVQIFDPSFRIADNLDMGSNPNAMPEMYIRGRSGIGTPELDADALSEYSLNNNPNLPVFIVDGFEVSVTRINDMDIERIDTYTILKDAAATAMYGSRAANGVVVITTRAPEAGKVNVSYSGNFAFSAPDLSSYNMMNAMEKIEAERRAGVFAINPSNQTNGGNLLRDYNEKLQNVERGIDTKWMMLPIRNALSHKHSLNINGGVDNFRYDADLTYDRNNGLMKGNYREKMGLGMSLAYTYEKLRIRNKAEVNSVKGEESPFGSFSDFSLMNPYDTYLNPDGSIASVMKQWYNANRRRNPMYDATLNSFNINKYNEFTNNFDVRYYITKDLSIESNIALNYKVDNRDMFKDPASGIFDGKPLDKGTYYKQIAESFSYDFNAKALYNSNSGKHNYNAVAAVNVRETDSDINSTNYFGFPEGGFSAPGYAKDIRSYSVANEKTRLIGLIGAINYSYNDIYMVDISGRLDGSSQFGANKKFAPFYALGAGINLHNYSFMKKNASWLSQLKIRATHGETGKTSFSSYTTLHKYSFITDGQYGTGDAMRMTYMGNPDLRWEKTVSTDVGLEMSIFDQIFYMKYTYYNKDTKDQIADMVIPTSSGFTSYKENVGRMRNKGHEVSLRARLYRNKDLVINVMANGTSNRSRLVDISNSMKSYNDRVNASFSAGTLEKMGKPLLKYIEGASTTSIYAMNSLGIDPATGRELYQYKDGTTGFLWIADENIVMGDTEPTLSGSFGTSILWKNFTLDCHFLYELGGQKYNSTLVDKVELADLRNKNADRRVLTDRWSAPGDVTRYRSILDYNTSVRPTSRFIQDNNNVRLSSLSLGYEFKQDFIKRAGIRRLKLQFNMRDVFTVSTIEIERGLSSPFARTFNMSVNITF